MSNLINNSNNNNIKTIKILLLGDKNTGKTALIEKICKKQFNYKNHIPTFGVNYNTLYLNKYDYTFNLDFWDLSGCKDYINLLKIYFIESDIILLCFDLTQKNTLESLYNFWLYEIKKIKGFKNKQLLIIGNKNDLNFKINDKFIKDYTIKMDLNIYRLSAKKTSNFEFLISNIIDKYCDQYKINKYSKKKRLNFFNKLFKFF